MAEPNMRAIVQNLTATSLWELGRLASKTFRFRRAPQRRDGAEGLTTVMLAAINSLKDHSGEITFKTQRSRYEKTELTIKLPRAYDEPDGAECQRSTDVPASKS